MKRTEFELLCRAVASGEEHFLENLETDHVGRAVTCSGDQVKVDIFGKEETWPSKSCHEISRPDFDYHR